MQKLAVVKTNAHSRLECAQLFGQHVQGTVAVCGVEEALMDPKAKKPLNQAADHAQNITLLCKVADYHHNQ